MRGRDVKRGREGNEQKEEEDDDGEGRRRERVLYGKRRIGEVALRKEGWGEKYAGGRKR